MKQPSSKPRRAAPAPAARAARAAVAEVDTLTWSGQLAAAVALATRWLGEPTLEAEARAELLDLRIECLLAIGDVTQAYADNDALMALARRERSASVRSRAEGRHSMILGRQGDTAASVTHARQALAQARRSGSAELEGLALWRLSEAQARLSTDLEVALAHARQAAALFERLGRRALVVRAWQAEFTALAYLGRTDEADAVASRGLQAAREIGDLLGQSAALNSLAFHEQDQALALQRFQQALAATDASGAQARRSALIANLGITYENLGLFHRARRLHLQAEELAERFSQKPSLLNTLWNRVTLEFRMRHPELARTTDRATALNRVLNLPRYAGNAASAEGGLLMLQGRPSEAVRCYERAAALLGSADPGNQLQILTDTTIAHLQARQLGEALAVSTRAADLHRARGLAPLNGLDAPALWWRHSQALRANGRRAEASAALAQAYRFVVNAVTSLSDEGLRRNALNKREERREIVLAWIRHARQRRLPAAEREAHLVGAANLREPFQRLVDSGVRLNELRQAVEISEFLVDEATELSGAERVLLVFESDVSGRHIAGSLLPRGESAEELLRAVGPWLDEARRTRQPRLRHGPEGSEPLDQRSCLVAPLVTGGQVIGHLYADLEGAFGRFHDTDRDLLGMLAAQGAVALANARWGEGLEAQVASRTAQLEQRNAEALAAQAAAEQRAAELAVINSIQQGIAGSLDFQGIVELVGDTLREVLKVQDISIDWYDEPSQLIHEMYGYEHGQRLAIGPPMPLQQRPTFQKLLQTRQPLVLNSQDQILEAGAVIVPGTDMARSAAFVPIMAGDRVLGRLTLESHEHEGAYGPAEVRLLQTVATSMGVALKSARLFDETQRLLKETEQRNAELAVINAVQQALAGELNIQGIYDAVGDKIREIFGGRDIGIRVLDDTGTMLLFPYAYEQGRRIELQPVPAPTSGRGITGHLARTRQPLLINENMAAVTASLGSYTLQGTVLEKRALLNSEWVAYAT